MNGLQRDRLHPAHDPLWDALVLDSPQGNAFLRSDCLRMLQWRVPGMAMAATGTLRYLLCDARGRPRAGWALPVRPWLGRALSHHFEFFYNGPLLCRALADGGVSAAAERFAALQTLATAVAADFPLAVCETHPSLTDLRALQPGPFQLVPSYTHRWALADLDALWGAMHRDKRREIRRAREQLRFAADRASDAVAAFIGLHRLVLRRFGQSPGARWAAQLSQRLDWLLARDGARLYSAWDQTGARLASVLVLLSREDHTGYLWRVGQVAAPIPPGTIAALYWQVAKALAGGPAPRPSSAPSTGGQISPDPDQDPGPDPDVPQGPHPASDPPWQWIDFGGSPASSLGRFKDSLGATPTLHFRLIRRRPGPRVWLWEGHAWALRALRGVRLRLHPLFAPAGRGSATSTASD